MNVSNHFKKPSLDPHLFLKKSESAFSINKAIEIIEAKASSNRCQCKNDLLDIKAILFTEGIIGAVFGFMLFLMIAENKGTLDHSKDKVTDLQVSIYMRPNVRRLTTEEGFLVDHSKDLFKSNFQEGLMAFFFLSFLPPLLLYPILKTVNITVAHFTHKTCDLIKKKKQISDDLIFSLKSLSVPDDSAPVPSDILLELFKLNYCTENELNLLNFSQINTLKKQIPSLFEKAFSEQKFSLFINEIFNKIEKIKKASPDLISKVFTNTYNQEQLFKKEPKILEVLIQELSDQQLTDPVHKSLQKALKMAITALERLDHNQMKDLINRIRQQNLSLKKAYRRLIVELPIPKHKINFLFNNPKEKPLNVKSALLIRESPVFERMLNGFFKESIKSEKAICLEDVNKKTFELMLNFLSKGELEITETDLISSDLISLLDLATQYQLSALHKKIEGYLFKHCDHYVETYKLLPLLEIIESYHLEKVKQKVDLIIASTTPTFYSDDFIPYLAVATKYQLNESLQKVAETLKSSLMPLSVDKDGSFCNRLAESLEHCPQLLFLLKSSLIELLEKKPTLLKELFLEAKKRGYKTLLENILTFIEDPNYAHISLANWILPPDEDSNKVNDSQKNDEKASSDVIIELS